MNSGTRVVVFCYEGDRHLVEMLLPHHLAHECPVTVFSPDDSRVVISGVECRHAGKRAYIGQESIDRLRGQLSMCLEYPDEFFFLHDADSFCLSPEIPKIFYRAAEENVVWSNEVIDPRPHDTPYRKIGMQPPYFLSRDAIFRILTAPVVPTHPITPFLDWWWTAHCWSANLRTVPFSYMEWPKPDGSKKFSDPWEWRADMIKNHGTVVMHPLKTAEQLRVARTAYELRAH